MLENGINEWKGHLCAETSSMRERTSIRRGAVVSGMWLELRGGATNGEPFNDKNDIYARGVIYAEAALDEKREPISAAFPSVSACGVRNVINAEKDIYGGTVIYGDRPQ